MALSMGTALLASAALQTGASLFGASKQASSANKGLALQRQMFQQAAGGLAPYMAMGTGAGNQLMALLGMGPQMAMGGSLVGMPTTGTGFGGPMVGPAAGAAGGPLGSLIAQAAGKMAPTATGVAGGAGGLPMASGGYGPTAMGSPTSILGSMPGYQWMLEEGLKGTQNSYAAKGLGTSGAAMKGAAQYATGLAESNWQKVANLLLGVMGTGAGAAGTMMGGAINAGTGMAQSAMNSGNAWAQGIQGAGNAIGGGIIGNSWYGQPAASGGFNPLMSGSLPMLAGAMESGF